MLCLEAAGGLMVRECSQARNARTLETVAIAEKRRLLGQRHAITSVKNAVARST